MNLPRYALAEEKFAEFIIQNSRIKAHYHEAGEGDKHLILVQTGGAGATAYMCWYMNLDAFAKAGYHVYAPDAVGFGLTEIISGSGISAAEFVVAFMGEMGIKRAHFVGNSMGSMTATRLALEHPRPCQEYDLHWRRAKNRDRRVPCRRTRAGQDCSDELRQADAH